MSFRLWISLCTVSYYQCLLVPWVCKGIHWWECASTLIERARFYIMLEEGKTVVPGLQLYLSCKAHA